MAKGPPSRRHEKAKVYWYTKCTYAVQSTESIDIFEMMITDELVEYITT